MTIVIKPGESIRVQFSETDGEINCDGCITVEFNQFDIAVIADLPDSVGRSGVIYRERFDPESNAKLLEDFSEDFIEGDPREYGLEN